jgi:hypothetical protein
MNLNIGLFTEIVRYVKLGTINALLICCKQYNEYQNNIALLKELKHMKLVEKCDVTIVNASTYSYINVLEWFHHSDYDFDYSKDAIYYAAKNGHINVFEWFHNSDYDFNYSKDAIYYAAKNGHINVLECFYKRQQLNQRGEISGNSQYEFKYSEDAIDGAAGNGHINVLEWFHNSQYEFKYSENAIDWAAKNG